MSAFGWRARIEYTFWYWLHHYRAPGWVYSSDRSQRRIILLPMLPARLTTRLRLKIAIPVQLAFEACNGNGII